MKHLKITSIDHINMNVEDLEVSVAFYRDLFGFREVKDQSDQRSKIIGSGKIMLCLYEDAEKVNDGGINHFGFYIENFDDVVSKCEEMDVEMPHGVVEWEKSRSVYITDPNGYEIELSEVEGGGLD